MDGRDVGGAGLAETGRNLAAPAVAGGALVVLGVGLQKIAGARLSEKSPAEDPPPRN